MAIMLSIWWRPKASCSLTKSCMICHCYILPSLVYSICFALPYSTQWVFYGLLLSECQVEQPMIYGSQ